MREYWDDLKPKVEAAYEEHKKGLPAGQKPEEPITFRNRIAKLLYDQESEDVKQSIKELNKRYKAGCDGERWADIPLEEATFLQKFERMKK